jgi:apolipoprotein N-acyltransferase
MITNFIFGNLIIKNHEKIEKNNLDTLIKVISPKIGINRFLQDVNPEEILLDLIKTSNPDKKKKTIFIFPEGVLSNIYLQDLKKYNYLFSENFSSKHKIILGINSYKDSKIFNSLVVIDNSTNILSKYDKNKLVPFGEFLPFENFFKKLGFKKITQGYLSFSSGDTRNLINIDNINFLPLICYEIIYSGNIKNNKNLDYDFILNISEDGWFGESVGPHQHFSHSIFRSIEEGKDIIRSANNGISAHINSKGQLISKIITTKKGFIELKSFTQVKKTHFSKHGNKIFFYFLIIYISLIAFLKLRENK